MSAIHQRTLEAQRASPPREQARDQAIDHPAAAPQSDWDMLSFVLSTARREGFDAGYRRALNEVLASSVFVAEKALLETEASRDLRRTLYRFIELLEKETLRTQHDESFSEGEGI